jgi:hypothetical protein
MFIEYLWRIRSRRQKKISNLVDGASASIHDVVKGFPLKATPGKSGVREPTKWTSEPAAVGKNSFGNSTVRSVEYMKWIENLSFRKGLSKRSLLSKRG